MHVRGILMAPDPADWTIAPPYTPATMLDDRFDDDPFELDATYIVGANGALVRYEEPAHAL